MRPQPLAITPALHHGPEMTETTGSLNGPEVTRAKSSHEVTAGPLTTNLHQRRINGLRPEESINGLRPEEKGAGGRIPF